jgi:hypothetical protein
MRRTGERIAFFATAACIDTPEASMEYDLNYNLFAAVILIMLLFPTAFDDNGKQIKRAVLSLTVLGSNAVRLIGLFPQSWQAELLLSIETTFY